MASQPTAWSYSRYSDYETCPAKYGFKYVEKIPEPGNEAMERGDHVHKQLAAYVRGDIPLANPYNTAPIPGWTYFGALLNELRDMDPSVEQEWGFTRAWAATGWFGNDVWFRSKLDVFKLYEDDTAEIIDNKTGKVRKEHATQAELYFLSAAKRYPSMKSANVRFWYIDQGKEIVYRFEADMVPGLLKRWTARAERMLMDRILAPNPGYHCKWCHYAKSNNGPCRYG